uniref:Uncharacterized protein n=1 Tax=Castor canadensis TaxID=51338 RepID=A0A8C0WST9_CASCN
MSVCALSPIRFPGSMSGFFQVASLLGLLLLLFKAVQLSLRRQWLLKAVQQFPSQPSHWLFGHKNECLCSLAWGSQLFVLVYDPDYMKVILGRSGGVNSHPRSSSLFRNGLLLLNGQTRFQHRRMLTPAFHYDVLKPYMEIMADSGVTVLFLPQDKWEQLIGQDSPLEIFQHVSLMTLDTIMKCAFSHTSWQGSVQLDSSFYIQAIGDLNYLTYSRVRNVFHQSDTIYRLNSDGRWANRACKITHEHTVIKLRKAQLQDEGELEKVRRKRHLDFLDILLFAKMENGSSLSDKDLCSEVDTFMFEGHDTTASGISWIFYVLATHPQHQQRCREEVQTLLGDGASLTWDHLDQMPYTTMCIKEALRLSPPVPSAGKELSTPVTFPDGCSLPKGIIVMLSFYALHHNPTVWPNPEVFDPSRFVPDSSRHSHSFLPFLGGSRNCIGKLFAMNELKVAVALTLLHFELLPDPTRVPIPITQVVLKSKNEIYPHLRKLQ